MHHILLFALLISDMQIAPPLSTVAALAIKQAQESSSAAPSSLSESSVEPRAEVVDDSEETSSSLSYTSSDSTSDADEIPINLVEYAGSEADEPSLPQILPAVSAASSAPDAELPPIIVVRNGVVSLASQVMPSEPAQIWPSSRVSKFPPIPLAVGRVFGVLLEHRSVWSKSSLLQELVPMVCWPLVVPMSDQQPSQATDMILPFCFLHDCVERCRRSLSKTRHIAEAQLNARIHQVTQQHPSFNSSEPLPWDRWLQLLCSTLDICLSQLESIDPHDSDVNTLIMRSRCAHALYQLVQSTDAKPYAFTDASVDLLLDMLHHHFYRVSSSPFSYLLVAFGTDIRAQIPALEGVSKPPEDHHLPLSQLQSIDVQASHAQLTAMNRGADSHLVDFVAESTASFAFPQTDLDNYQPLPSHLDSLCSPMRIPYLNYFADSANSRWTSPMYHLQMITSLRVTAFSAATHLSKQWRCMSQWIAAAASSSAQMLHQRLPTDTVQHSLHPTNPMCLVISALFARLDMLPSSLQLRLQICDVGIGR